MSADIPFELVSRGVLNSGGESGSKKDTAADAGGVPPLTGPWRKDKSMETLPLMPDKYCGAVKSATAERQVDSFVTMLEFRRRAPPAWS